MQGKVLPRSTVNSDVGNIKPQPQQHLATTANLKYPFTYIDLIFQKEEEEKGEEGLTVLSLSFAALYFL